MADKEVRVKLKLEDDYSDGVAEAKDKTDDLKRSIEEVSNATLEENVAFMTTLETLDKFGSSISKIRGGLEDTGLVSEETARQLLKVQGAVDLIVGSAEIMLIVQKALNSSMLENIKITRAQALAMGTLGATAASVGLAYMAVNAGSREQKALFSALTGITTGLAAAQFTLALAEYSERVASAGPLAPVVAGLILGALTAGATYITAMRSKSASAQTETGEFRKVEETGIVLAHKGEIIGRVSPPSEAKSSGPSEVRVVVEGFLKPIDERALSDAIAQAIRFGGGA